MYQKHGAFIGGPDGGAQFGTDSRPEESSSPVTEHRRNSALHGTGLARRARPVRTTHISQAKAGRRRPDCTIESRAPKAEKRDLYAHFDRYMAGRDQDCRAA